MALKINQLPKRQPPTTEEEIMNFLRWAINNDRISFDYNADSVDINCTEDMAEKLLLEYLIGNPEDCKESD